MRRDRLWQLGGALFAVVLLAFGWFFFIDPEYKSADDLHTQTDAANDQVATLQRRLGELRTQNEHLDEYKAELAKNRSALPTADSVADLLRELQVAGELAGVTVTGVTVGTSTKVAAGDTKIDALPIAVTASGATGKLTPFLDQLQQVQPRAVLISAVNIAPAGAEGSNTANLTINLQAFYASGS